MNATDGGAPQNVLGYSHIDAGLNNQKLALFGLFLKADREGPRRLSLPDFALFDQVSSRHVCIPLQRAFKLDPLRDFASRHDIDLVETSPRGTEQVGWKLFHYATHAIQHAALLNELGPDSFACDFLRALVPEMRESELLSRVVDAALEQRNIRLAVQLRIEKDWLAYSARGLKQNVGRAEDNAPSLNEIFAKVARTLPVRGTSIYVVCDETALPAPKEDIRRIVKAKFDIDLFWKSDFLTAAELEQASLFELSMLDFEVAVAARSFAGITRSMFSKLVTVEKYARARVKVEAHYAYNALGPRLMLRRDNGAFDAVALATATDPLDPAHSFEAAEVCLLAGDKRGALDRYVRRAASGGSERDEIFISLYRVAHIKAELGFPATEVIDAFRRATETDPLRAEPLHGASRHCRLNSRFEEGYEFARRGIDLMRPSEGPFVEKWIYDWALLDEYAANAFLTRRYLECIGACLTILARDSAPTDQRQRIIRLARMATDQLKALPATMVGKSASAALSEKAASTPSSATVHTALPAP